MAEVMIQAKSLRKMYGDFCALDDVSFEIERGEVLGFLGPNGAGKSTTMRILTCFIAPTSGTAKVNDADIFDDALRVRESVGYLPESTPLYTEMLVDEYLSYVAELRGYRGQEADNQIKKAVGQTSLGDVRHKEIRALSKGYRQRVGLAQALVHEPPILILDEPMSGLDPNQATEIRNLIKEIGEERTVILSTHNLSEVEKTAGRVLIISDGKLVADDTPESLREQSGRSTFSVVLGQKGGGDAVEKLRAHPGVRDVSEEEIAAGEILLSVIPNAEEDLRPSIFELAKKESWPLLELRREAVGLGDVFKSLTKTIDSDQEEKNP